MHWFYDPEIKKNSRAITSAELVHFKSLRLRTDEQIAITNGQGGVLYAKCVDASSGEIEPESFQDQERPKTVINLVQSLAKGGRDEAALQAAVELGVSSITPLQAARSIVEWGDKAARNQDRWQQIAISAMKQSQQAFLPVVKPLVKSKNLEKAGQTIVLSPTGDKPLTSFELDSEVTLMVGPEGGFEPNELDNFVGRGFELARLGSSVLRTSTAGPAAIAAIMALTGTWG